MNDSSLQVPHALYIAQGQSSDSDHIIDHLNLESLLCIQVLGYVKRALVGALFS